MLKKINDIYGENFKECLKREMMDFLNNVKKKNSVCYCMYCEENGCDHPERYKLTNMEINGIKKFVKYIFDIKDETQN